MATATKKKHSTRTKSPLNRSERLEKAYSYYARGYSVTDVARLLKVDRKTAAAYKTRYEGRLTKEAEANPRLLTDVVQNTVRALHELDEQRKDIWRRMKDRKIKFYVECPECGDEFQHTYELPLSDQSIASYHNTLLKAADQRTKLFGLMGVKQETFLVFQQVDQVQRFMIEWLMRELPAEFREKLAKALEQRFPEYATLPALPAPPVDDDDIVDAELV